MSVSGELRAVAGERLVRIVELQSLFFKSA
jgi:hypothetical protein